MSLLISTSLLTGSFARFLRLRCLRQALLTALLVRRKTFSRLVVEVGTAVDVVEVLEGELGAAPLPAARRAGDLVRPGDGGAAGASAAPSPRLRAASPTAWTNSATFFRAAQSSAL